MLVSERKKEKEINQVLGELYSRLQNHSKYTMGYPSSVPLVDFSPLYPFLSLSMINNIGDPFQSSGVKMNTHDLECKVVEWFKHLFRVTHYSLSSDNVWGYITSGGTESNIFAGFCAREYYPNGILYHSRTAHYSVYKVAKLLQIPSVIVNSQPHGEIDYEDFENVVRSDFPVIIFANIGTTMHGAIDDVVRLREIVEKKCSTKCFIHADAAFSGMFLPFFEGDKKLPKPNFDFTAGIDSIAVSGHKFCSLPFACGVVLIKQVYVHTISKMVEYIHARDDTLSGSRSGLAPLFWWYLIQKLGTSGFQAVVQSCFSVAEFGVQYLRKCGVDVWRHPYSLTVVLSLPFGHEKNLRLQKVLSKWQIAVQGDEAHFIATHNVTPERIVQFAHELALSKNAQKY